MAQGRWPRVDYRFSIMRISLITVLLAAGGANAFVPPRPRKTAPKAVLEAAGYYTGPPEQQNAVAGVAEVRTARAPASTPHITHTAPHPPPIARRLSTRLCFGQHHCVSAVHIRPTVVQPRHRQGLLRDRHQQGSTPASTRHGPRRQRRLQLGLLRWYVESESAPAPSCLARSSAQQRS